jgi:flagellin
MDVLGSASFVLQNEALTQNRLATDVNALASGLRVSSAVNDPSGYAIGATIHSKIAGLQQSVTNVQTANNLLNVADGALNSVELILQRIRSLAVESNSDFNSQTDLQNIQSEINQLLLEINKISANTQFNGLNIFNGQFDNGSSGITNQAASITEIASPVLNADGSQGNNYVSNSQIDNLGNATTPGPGPLVEPFHQLMTQQVPALLVFQVISYSSSAVDPDTGINVGPGVYVEFQAYSQNANMGAAPLYTDISAVPVNSGPIINAQYDSPIAFGGGPAYLLLQFSLANLTAQDVGASAAFITTLASPAGSATGQPLQVNDGGSEGTVISINIPQMSTNVLNISDISVTAPATSNYMNEVTGQSSSNAIAASDAILRVDSALNLVNEARAQIGAQTVSLQQDAGNDTTLILNETNAASNILDANIGQTVTDFTKQQILTKFGTSVLSQIEVSAQQLTALLLNSFSGLSAGQGSGGGAIA